MFTWKKPPSPDTNGDAPTLTATGTITALREHPRKAGRYIVDINGKQAAVVGAAYIHDARLKVGMELDDVGGDKLIAAARKVEAFDRAAAALGRRARSKHELERWLLQRGYDAADVAEAVARLSELGALDDSQYARAFSRSRALGKGMSRRRLQQELARRGVSREQADQAIAEVMDEEAVDERALLEAAARKKMTTLAGLDPDTAKRRLAGFLARRGYDASAVSAVVRKLMAERASV